MSHPEELVARYREHGLWGTRTIAEELHAVALAHPDRDAVVAAQGRRTYAEPDAETDRIAVGLAELGLRPGDPVIVQVTNRLETVVAWYALLKAGLVPVATLAAHRGHEIAHISRMVAARAHLVEAPHDGRAPLSACSPRRSVSGTTGIDLVAFAHEQARDHPTLRDVLVLGDLPAPDVDHTEARKRVEEIQHGIDPDDVAVFQLSGGTTGVSKLIPRRHAEYWYNARQVAMPLTARVIARLVGVPTEDSDELARLSLEITAILPAPFVGTGAWQRLEEYFVAASVARRTSEDPPDDMITRLVRGRVDGRELSDREVAFHAWQLFVAALENTAYTIGSTVYHLLADRTRWEALLADRSLLDNAREEGLRHGSAIRWVLRTVARPATAPGGEAMAPGDRVVVGLESANMDERVFGDDADDFVLGRPTARRHFSFGHGAHLCLGAELSRIEISTVLAALLDRLPGLRLADGAEWRDVASPMFCGPRRVDVVWPAAG